MQEVKLQFDFECDLFDRGKPERRQKWTVPYVCHCSNAHVPRLHGRNLVLCMLCFVIDCGRLHWNKYIRIFRCVISTSAFHCYPKRIQSHCMLRTNRAHKWKHCFPLYNPRLPDNKNENSNSKKETPPNTLIRWRASAHQIICDGYCVGCMKCSIAKWKLLFNVNA